jgi:hypothetical protein
MTNIAVTGASRGLGKAIADYAKSFNFQVTEYTSNDNLLDFFVRKKIINDSCDIDVFISCAKPGFAQTELLYEWYERYRDEKVFISIGSEISCIEFWGNDIHMMRYHTQKKSLKHAVEQLNNKNIILINPGHLYDNTDYDYVKLNKWCKQNFKDIFNGL